MITPEDEDDEDDDGYDETIKEEDESGEGGGLLDGSNTPPSSSPPPDPISPSSITYSPSSSPPPSPTSSSPHHHHPQDDMKQDQEKKRIKEEELKESPKEVIEVIEEVIPVEDPEVKALRLAEEALSLPDAILEPDVATHIATIVNIKPNEGGGIITKRLKEGLEGRSASCGLLAHWIISLRTGGDQNSGNNGNNNKKRNRDTATNDKEKTIRLSKKAKRKRKKKRMIKRQQRQQLQQNQQLQQQNQQLQIGKKSNTKHRQKRIRKEIATRIRSIISEVFARSALSAYNVQTGESTILSLKKESDRAFLPQMMDTYTWRSLLLRLAADPSNNGSALLGTYCLGEIGKRGFYGEICRVLDVSLEHDVFRGMLESELYWFGRQQNRGSSGYGNDGGGSGGNGSGNNNNGDDDDNSNTHNDEMEGNTITLGGLGMFHDRAFDLRRTCTATSHTYLYSMVVVNALIKRARERAQRLLFDNNNNNNNSSMKTNDEEKCHTKNLISRYISAAQRWEALRDGIEGCMLSPAGVDLGMGRMDVPPPPSSSPSTTIGGGNIVGEWNQLARKRRVEVAIWSSELYRKRRRRTITNDNDNNNNNNTTNNNQPPPITTFLHRQREEDIAKMNHGLEARIIELTRRANPACYKSQILSMSSSSNMMMQSPNSSHRRQRQSLSQSAIDANLAESILRNPHELMSTPTTTTTATNGSGGGGESSNGNDENYGGGKGGKVGAILSQYPVAIGGLLRGLFVEGRGSSGGSSSGAGKMGAEARFKSARLVACAVLAVEYAVEEDSRLMECNNDGGGGGCCEISHDGVHKGKGKVGDDGKSIMDVGDLAKVRY